MRKSLKDMLFLLFSVARVGWWSDGSVMVQLQNRAQNILQLLKVNPCTGK